MSKRISIPVILMALISLFPFNVAAAADHSENENELDVKARSFCRSPRPPEEAAVLPLSELPPAAVHSSGDNVSQ